LLGCRFEAVFLDFLPSMCPFTSHCVPRFIRDVPFYVKPHLVEYFGAAFFRHFYLFHSVLNVYDIAPVIDRSCKFFSNLEELDYIWEYYHFHIIVLSVGDVSRKCVEVLSLT
jgi:hypothetical protein